MSTKSTLKYNIDDKTGAGYHLYNDLADTFGDEEPGCHPVYLELRGVDFDAICKQDFGGRVCVTIPREWAEKLGLVALLRSPA